MAGPVEILRANRARVLRTAETTDVNAVNRLLADARRELERRLADAKRRGLGERYTADRIRATIAVVRDVQDHLARAMHANAKDRFRKLAERGIEDVARYVTAMEKRYTGVTPELAIDRAVRFDALVSGTEASLLRQHEVSVDRYGTHMIGEMENAMRLGVATGATTDQMINAIVKTNAPEGWRPGEGMTAGEGKVAGEFVRQQYWAERIVRTESMFSYNSSGWRAMVETHDADFPDMKRIIVATFDSRTADDSKYVHGQIRGVREQFYDGKKYYLHPPNRPNDRECVVAHRPHWPIPAVAQPR